MADSKWVSTSGLAGKTTSCLELCCCRPTIANKTTICRPLPPRLHRRAKKVSAEIVAAGFNRRLDSLNVAW